MQNDVTGPGVQYPQIAQNVTETEMGPTTNFAFHHGLLKSFWWWPMPENRLFNKQSVRRMKLVPTSRL
jgi:hypothetical protein